MPVPALFGVAPRVILPGQRHTGASIEADLRSGAVGLVLAIAAHALQVGIVVLGAAFGDRQNMVNLSRHRDQALGQARLAPRLISQLARAQLAPASIAALGPAIAR